jgi:hypothetical protein
MVVKVGSIEQSLKEAIHGYEEKIFYIYQLGDNSRYYQLLMMILVDVPFNGKKYSWSNM